MNILRGQSRLLSSMKSFWIVMLMISGIIFLLYMNFYTSTANNIMQAQEIMHQNEEAAILEGAVFDISSSKALVDGMIISVTPVLGPNNALFLLLMIGLLGMPIAGALFVGIEYGQRTIKYRVAYQGLKKTILSKLLVIQVLILLVTVAFWVFGYVSSRILWRHYFSAFDSEKELFTGSIEVNHLRMLAFIVLALSFYSLIAMAVTFIAKNSVAGIVASFVVSYGEAYLPLGLMPRWNFFHMGQYIFHTNGDGFSEFIIPSQIRTLDPPLNLLWILVLMALMISLMFHFVGNKQRN